MKITLVYENPEQWVVEREFMEGYAVPDHKPIMEWQEKVANSFFEMDVRRIQVDGVCLGFFRKNIFCDEVKRVRCDFPYLQMHFELYGGGAFYTPQSGADICLPTPAGMHTLFYVPELNGQLVYPAGTDIFSLEIEISLDWLKHQLGEEMELLGGFSTSVAHERPVMLGGREFPITPAMYRVIFDLYHCAFSGYLKKLYVESKIVELLTLQIDQMVPPDCCCRQEKVPGKEVGRLVQVRDAIGENLSYPYTIEELAGIALMNRTKLQSLFKQLFGQTIHEFVLTRRMEAARRLLEKYPEEISIAEISERVGYKNYNHFSAAFRKQYGYPPSHVQQFCRSR